MQKAKIISIVGDRVTASLEDGQTLTVPISDIEGSPKEGQDIAVIVVALGSEDAGRHKLAQDLLNDLLKA